MEGRDIRRLCRSLSQTRFLPQQIPLYAAGQCVCVCVWEGQQWLLILTAGVNSCCEIIDCLQSHKTDDKKSAVNNCQLKGNYIGQMPRLAGTLTPDRQST